MKIKYITYIILGFNPIVAQTLVTPSGTVGTSATANTGIGTTQPQVLLELSTASTGTQEILRLTNRSGAIGDGSAINFNYGADGISNSIARIYSYATGSNAGDLRFGTSNGSYTFTDRMAILANGNVVIGGNYTSYKFDVQGATPGAGHSRFLNTNGSIYFDIEGTVAGSNNSAIVRLRNGGATTAMIFSNGAANDLNIATGTNGGVTAMRIDANANVGLGTTNPFAKLAIERSGGDQVIVRYNDGNARSGFYTGATSGSTFVGGNLTHASGNIFNYDKTGLMWHLGNPSGQSFFGIGVGSGISGSSAGTDGNNYMRLVIDSSGNVGIGTTSPTHKLAVNGSVRAKEVIVDTGWSDYVFSAEYRLAPLSEVETHIQAKKHLPGIPSANEVEAQGVSLGEMQSALLAKIEELTLHLIAQEKRIGQQSARIEKLEAENRLLLQPRR